MLIPHISDTLVTLSSVDKLSLTTNGLISSFFKIRSSSLVVDTCVKTNTPSVSKYISKSEYNPIKVENTS